MSASFFTILGCKTLQALSFCVKIEVIELEKEVDYEIPRTQQKTSCDQAFYRPAGRSKGCTDSY